MTSPIPPGAEEEQYQLLKHHKWLYSLTRRPLHPRGTFAAAGVFFSFFFFLLGKKN
jgi:hypothetical protein